jgi:tellurite resistance protein
MNPIAYLPIGFFGAAMGLSGLCVAWRLAAVLFGLPLFVAEAIGFLAVLAFLLIAAGYVAKLAFFPARVAAEWNHPVIGPLFSTIPISLLLLPIVLRPYASGIAALVWILGAARRSINSTSWLLVSASSSPSCCSRWFSRGWCSGRRCRRR